MRIVLDDRDSVCGSQRLDRLEITGDPGVVHWDYRARPPSDKTSEVCFIQIKRVRTNVTEDDAGTSERERIRGRAERERRYDDVTLRPELQEQRGELERMRARCREENAGPVEEFLKQAFAPGGE